MNGVPQSTALELTTIHRIQKQEEWNKLLYWFSFFMAVPVILIVQNISIYIFLMMVFFAVKNIKGKPLSIVKPLQWGALFFGIGAIASVMNIPFGYAEDSTERALAVLPNYLYWSVLIIFLITHRRLLDIQIIYKAMFWGVIAMVIYYFLLQQTLRVLPIFNRHSPNSFSFLLICFAPMAVSYLAGWKGRWWALFFLMCLVVLLLLEGRRAGMVLVLFGGLGALYLKDLSIKTIFVGIILTIMSGALLFTSAVEHVIFIASERIHQMIYLSEQIQKEDRSYLVRVAMVKKGMSMYEKYPVTGVGLNNFTNYDTEISGDFVGSRYVIHKKGLNDTSAHNSYVAVLAEGGLMLFIPMAFILGLNLLYFFVYFRSIYTEFYPVFIALAMMCIHFYFISAVVNVYAWYLIGLACAFHYRKIKVVKKGRVVQRPVQDALQTGPV